MIAFLDIETGGFSKEKNALCEVGILFVDDNNTIVHKYETLIRPYERESGELFSYKNDAMVVHGITEQQLQEQGKPILVVCDSVIDLLRAYNVHTIAGHGITKFDIPWLNYLMMRFNGFNLIGYKVIDTLTMARDKGHHSNSLDDLCIVYDIEKQGHRALPDAMASFELYKKFIKA